MGKENHGAGGLIQYTEKYMDLKLHFTKYNYISKFDGSVITGKDCLLYKEELDYILNCLGQNKDKSVLEFGCGGSTVILSQYAKNIVSLETHSMWSSEIAEFLKSEKIDNVTIHNKRSNISDYNKFDFIFIDSYRETRGSALQLVLDEGICHDKTLIFFHDWKKYYHEVNPILSSGLVELVDTVNVHWPPSDSGKPNVAHLGVLRKKKNA